MAHGCGRRSRCLWVGCITAGCSLSETCIPVGLHSRRCAARMGATVMVTVTGYRVRVTPSGLRGLDQGEWREHRAQHTGWVGGSSCCCHPVGGSRHWASQCPAHRRCSSWHVPRGGAAARCRPGRTWQQVVRAASRCLSPEAEFPLASARSARPPGWPVHNGTGRKAGLCDMSGVEETPCAVAPNGDRAHAHTSQVCVCDRQMVCRMSPVG